VFNMMVSENKSEKIFEPSQRFYAVFGRVIGKDNQEKEKKDNDSDQSRKILTPQKKEKAFNASPVESDFPAKESCNEEPGSNVSVFEKLSNHRSKIESNPKRKNSKDLEKNPEAQGNVGEKMEHDVSVFQKLSHGKD
ncbi:hypothetical protein KEJ21_06840, partial [Candidatus Bathyarchaeota archaeon]|nr:hypothetical protein [Candidatus Bathyarchaeota archaeon]